MESIALTKTLDQVHESFLNDQCMSYWFAVLCRTLSFDLFISSSEEWQEIINTCRAHPLFDLFQQDPLTHRAFVKPRGYAGDAVMLDYVCDGKAPEGTSLVGRRIMETVSRSPSGAAVRERRALVARLIDEVALNAYFPEIVSVACGHLREADLSMSLVEGKLGNWFALDQDQHSLDHIDANYGTTSIKTSNVSVKDLLTGRAKYYQARLIYSLGLYDYLPERVAQKLTSILFDALAPEGTLLIANFVPQCFNRGYMEAFADWFLIYRNDQEMNDCTKLIDAKKIGKQETFFDATGDITYLQVKKL